MQMTSSAAILSTLTCSYIFNILMYNKQNVCVILSVVVIELGRIPECKHLRTGNNYGLFFLVQK